MYKTIGVSLNSVIVIVKLLCCKLHKTWLGLHYSIVIGPTENIRLWVETMTIFALYTHHIN